MNAHLQCFMSSGNMHACVCTSWHIQENLTAHSCVAQEGAVSTSLIVAASLPLAALAGSQIALLMLPCVRWARSAFAVLQPPLRMPPGDLTEMLGMPLEATALSRAMIRAAAAAPLFVLLLWARPFAAELLGIDAALRTVLQAAGLMLCGADLHSATTSAIIALRLLHDGDLHALHVASQGHERCCMHIQGFFNTPAHVCRSAAAAGNKVRDASLLQRRQSCILARQERSLQEQREATSCTVRWRARGQHQCAVPICAGPDISAGSLFAGLGRTAVACRNVAQTCANRVAGRSTVQPCADRLHQSAQGSDTRGSIGMWLCSAACAQPFRSRWPGAVQTGCDGCIVAASDTCAVTQQDVPCSGKM